ncbi:MAG: hypothetical protein L0Y61_09005 [Epsilonproteobacteria bacterium]|nr:hypothetical protein [Campylobacterota bacterium]
MQKVVSISIDEDLNKRWGRVAQKLSMTKSGIVEDFLVQILPILEQKSLNGMVISAMQEFEKAKDLIDESTKSLFDDLDSGEDRKAV